MKRLTLIFLAAALGCVLLVAGVALIYPPVALVVAGILLLAYAWLALDALGAADR